MSSCCSSDRMSFCSRGGVSMFAVGVGGAGVAGVCVGLLGYRWAVKWNTDKVIQYEADVINDSTTLLATLKATSSKEDEDENNVVEKAKANTTTQQSAFSTLEMGDQTKVNFKNRIIKAATYEALCDINGVPLPGLADFHVKMVDGGCGMTIVAYAGEEIGLYMCWQS